MTFQRSPFGIEDSGNLRSSGAENAVFKVAAGLTAFGLTPNQARIFLELTVLGPCAARPVYEVLGIHKVDAYRNLQVLQRAGLVEIQMGSPAVYSALDPVAALSILVKKKEDEITLSKSHLAEMASEIRALKRLGLNRAEERQNRTRYIFRTGQGSEGSFSEWRNWVEKAETEILRISGGVLQTDRARILAATCARAKDRGVSVRIITQISATNRAHFKRLSKVVSLRQIERVPLRVGIADRKKVLLYPGSSPGVSAVLPRDDNYLVIEDEQYAEGFASYFERLWDGSKPVDF